MYVYKVGLLNSDSDIKVLTARKMEAPICRKQFRSPDAKPASFGSKPLVARIVIGANIIPTPRPISILGAHAPEPYESVSFTKESQNKPAAPINAPAWRKLRAPYFAEFLAAVTAPIPIINDLVNGGCTR